MALVAAALTVRLLAPLLLFVAAAVIVTGCGIGRSGASATLALAVDQSNPDKPVTQPLTGAVLLGQEFLIRLELEQPSDASAIRVRLEKRVGASFLQRGELEVAITPPWHVAILPITLFERGHWNVSLIVNSRKITDIRFDVERP